jgi:hypothetical protein
LLLTFDAAPCVGAFAFSFLEEAAVAETAAPDDASPLVVALVLRPTMIFVILLRYRYLSMFEMIKQSKFFFFVDGSFSFVFVDSCYC